MIEVARTQDEEVGDGTTSVIILGKWFNVNNHQLSFTESDNFHMLLWVVYKELERWEKKKEREENSHLIWKWTCCSQSEINPKHGVVRSFISYLWKRFKSQVFVWLIRILNSMSDLYDLWLTCLLFHLGSTWMLTYEMFAIILILCHLFPGGEMLSVAEPFLQQQMHPTVIISAFRQALEDLVEILRDKIRYKYRMISPCMFVFPISSHFVFFKIVYVISLALISWKTFSI